MAQAQAKSRSSLDRRYFVGDLDDRAAILWLWREERDEIEPKNPSGNLVVQLGGTTDGLNRCWYERITGRMSPSRYIVALCYSTAVILLGLWPSNVLLILFAVPNGKHNLLHFSVFVTSEASVRSKLFCLRRGSL